MLVDNQAGDVAVNRVLRNLNILKQRNKWDVQSLRYLDEAATTHTVLPLFVFLHLLRRNADEPGKFALREPAGESIGANVAANEAIDCLLIFFEHIASEEIFVRDQIRQFYFLIITSPLTTVPGIKFFAIKLARNGVAKEDKTIEKLCKIVLQSHV